METISIKDENGKEYVFEKPEFECELLKVVNGCIVAYVVYSGNNFAVLYYTDGKAVSLPEKFDLTLAKPKWYEDEDCGRAVVFLDENGEFDHVNVLYGDDFKKTSNLKAVEGKPNGWRLATKEELLSLYVEEQ